VRETRVEFVALFDLLDVLLGKLQIEGFDIGLEMGNLVATNDGIYVRCLRSRMLE
jgi:hypothetical protein